MGTPFDKLVDIRGTLELEVSLTAGLIDLSDALDPFTSNLGELELGCEEAL